MKPYTSPVQPRIATTALFLVPLIVYLHQRIILLRAAHHLFFEPLHDRGMLGQPLRAQTRRIRRFLDTALVTHWSVVLFGLVLECLFWLGLKCSEGKDAMVYSKFRLAFRLLMVVQWYMIVGARSLNNKGAKIASVLFFAIVALNLVDATRDLKRFGLTPRVVARYRSIATDVLIWYGSVHVYVALRKNSSRLVRI